MLESTVSPTPTSPTGQSTSVTSYVTLSTTQSTAISSMIESTVSPTPTEQSTSVTSYVTLWTTQSTAISTMLESTVSPTPYQYSSTTSMLTNTETQTTSSVTSAPTVTTNTYIRFTLSFSMNNENLTIPQLASELLAIFISALGIHSNQINITVTIPLTRTLMNVVAQVRLFDSATESADSLLAQILQQLADPSSALRSDELTSQLTPESISDVTRIYNCGGSTEQEIPCGATTTTQSTSTSSLAKILLLTIIPSVIVAVLLVVVIVLIVRHSTLKKKEICRTPRKGFVDF
jgi:hypothetical protein